MAKIHKIKELFKPIMLTKRQKKIADEKYEKLMNLTRGKIIIRDENAFNLGLS